MARVTAPVAPASTGPASDTGVSPNGSTDAGTADSLARWVIAWAAGILIIWLLNKSRWGHTIIYYTLVLMLVFLALTQYQWIAWVLQPFSHIGAAPSESSNDPGGSGTPPPESPPGTPSKAAALVTEAQSAASGAASYLTTIPRRVGTHVRL